MNVLEYSEIIKKVIPSLPFEITWDPSHDYPFNAFTNISDWRITIQIHPGFRNRIGDEKLNSLLYTLLKHEEGHWKVCPYDGQDHLNIRASIYKAFREKVKGNYSGKAEPLCGAVVNMFEDLIVDRVSKEGDDNYIEGIKVALDTQKREMDKHKNALSDLMLAMREGFVLGSPVRKEAGNILKTIEGGLIDKEGWIPKSYSFASKIFEFLKEKGELDKLQDEEIMVISKILTSESIHERRLKEDNPYREEMFKEYFRKSGGEGEPKKHKGIDGFSSPIYDDLESLDQFYQSKVEDVRLDYYRIDRASYPLTYLGKSRLPEGRSLSLSRIKWPATKIIMERGEETIFLYEKEIPYVIKGDEQKKGRILFDLALILDSSGSMGSVYNSEAPYSILITAVYSLFHHLRETGKDIYINYCIINFSRENWYSEWHDHSTLDKMRKEVILRKQGGGTVLRGMTIKTMVCEAKGPFLAIMVTDGELKSPVEPAKAIGELLSQGNEFCLIKIGKAGDEFTRLVEKAGGDVYVINKASDLSGLILKKGMAYW